MERKQFQRVEPIELDASIDKAMAEWAAEENRMVLEIKQHNEKLLNRLTKILGKEFVSDIKECLQESEAVGELRIVRKPKGQYQEEDYTNSSFDGVWVEQWTRGMCEDCYSGYVTIQLDDKRYLETSFEM